MTNAEFTMKHSNLLATDGQHSIINDQAHVSRAYTPYGQAAAQSGPLSAFNGERRDPLTGCYHLGNGYRQFNPVTMRFQAPDTFSPFGKGGMNAYMYCAGDPVNQHDPSGANPLLLSTTAKIPTTPMPAVSPLVTSMAVHVLNGSVGVLNIAGVAMAAVNPVPSSRLGWLANKLTLGGAVGSLSAIGMNYLLPSKAEYVLPLSAASTTAVAAGLGINVGFAAKRAGPALIQNIKDNAWAVFSLKPPKGPRQTREQRLDDVGVPLDEIVTGADPTDRRLMDQNRNVRRSV
jgi:RHS repeat-associated protein